MKWKTTKNHSKDRLLNGTFGGTLLHRILIVGTVLADTVHLGRGQDWSNNSIFFVVIFKYI